MAHVFHADVEKGWSVFIGEQLKLKCFMGGWCCFPGELHPPSTRVAYCLNDLRSEDKPMESDSLQA